MPCYHPLTAYQCADGSVVFQERKGNVVKTLTLPCGQCVGCRLERSRQWAMRCMHEASLHRQNSFITLTYAPDNLPDRGQLDYSHFQKFMKRLRKRLYPVKPRFYMCGEYGETTSRPHFHACIFGFDFPDKVLYKRSGSGSCLYRSAVLEELWPFGHSLIGDVTFESAAYVARYVMKKVTGHNAKEHYERVCEDTGEVYTMVPEFTRMSLKPGIGAGWFDKYQSDVYPHDYVVVRGKETKPPKYYDRLLERVNPDMLDGVKFERELAARSNYLDNTDERLLVKEQVKKAAISSFRRGLE